MPTARGLSAPCHWQPHKTSNRYWFPVDESECGCATVGQRLHRPALVSARPRAGRRSRNGRRRSGTNRERPLATITVPVVTMTVRAPTIAYTYRCRTCAGAGPATELCLPRLLIVLRTRGGAFGGQRAFGRNPGRRASSNIVRPTRPEVWAISAIAAPLTPAAPTRTPSPTCQSDAEVATQSVVVVSAQHRLATCGPCLTRQSVAASA